MKIYFINLLNSFKEIKKLNNNKIDTFFTILISFIFSLLIISGPLALLINIFILFNDSRIFLSFIFSLIFSLLIFLTSYFSLKSLIKENKIKILNISIFFMIISLFFGIIVVVILLLIGVL